MDRRGETGGDMLRCEYIGGSGHAETSEVRSRHVEAGVERTEGAEMGRLGKVHVDELHEYFNDRLHTGQLVNIPYRTIRSQKNEPKEMTVRLKHYMGLKGNMYKRLKVGKRF